MNSRLSPSLCRRCDRRRLLPIHWGQRTGPPADRSVRTTMSIGLLLIIYYHIPIPMAMLSNHPERRTPLLLLPPYSSFGGILFLLFLYLPLMVLQLTRMCTHTHPDNDTTSFLSPPNFPAIGGMEAKEKQVEDGSIPKVIHVVGRQWQQESDSWKTLNPEYVHVGILRR